MMSSGARRVWQVSVAVFLLAMAGCTRGSRPAQETRLPIAISQSEWQLVGSQKIFFGHQSVGASIVAAVRQLATDDHASLNIVNSDNPETVTGPALVETMVGTNGDPQSKDKAFAKAVNGGLGAQGGIALYKYCFVDVQRSTDPDQLYERYRANLLSLRQQYPRLVVVPVTLPLTTVEGSFEAAARKLLGRPSRRDLDVKRERFNDRLRADFASSGPFFDLAAVESRHADGSREQFQDNGKAIQALAPEWSSDGAHLNTQGAQRAAAELIRVLSEAARLRPSS